MAEPGLVLVHSPLLGAFSWQGVASRLRAGGHRVIAPDFSQALLEASPLYPKIARAIAKDVEELPGDIVLIGHSGAGALLPSIAAAVGPRVRGILFVDAVLPHPGMSWLNTVPPDFATRVRELSSDGFLPPWHEWWPPHVIAHLLPDGVQRTTFMENLDRRPFAYFDEKTPDIEIPATARCAYLQLSPGYETEAERSRELGWPVESRSLGHLAMVTEAAKLARHIQGSVANLGV
jgi:pimeloyl-ACP methyl ester carboxylesterase